MRAASSPHEVLRWLRAAAPRSAHLQGSESSGEVRNRSPETSGSESLAFLQEIMAVCYISPVSHRQFASPRLPLYCCAVSAGGWATRTSPLTARRVALAPKSCGSSFRVTSSRATCRVRSPSFSEETCMGMGTCATIRPHFGHLILSPFRDFASARAIAPPSTRAEPALQ